MKRLVLFLLIIIDAIFSFAQPAGLNIIPQPYAVKMSGGYLNINKSVTISISNDSIRQVAEVFASELMGYISVQFVKKDCDIELIQDKDFAGGTEAYELIITQKQVTIRAKRLNGLFYGLQSLRQIILFSPRVGETLRIPSCKINDSPRFGWRGFMVDESRHFFGKEKIRQLLDLMALHKLNVFHWHLTDDPGWRIEILKYPKLTLLGGVGNKHDPNAEAKYYSQSEISELIAYAKARYIQIIPEIDMPGHAAAANKAYPKFSGGGSPKYPDFTFNPGKEQTYGYLTDILSEVSRLFPSPFLHLGGDEVHFGNEQWSTNQDVMKLMDREKIADLKGVETYFNLRMADSLKRMGKTLVGWDEIVDTRINPAHSVVMWWRQEKPEQLQKAFEGGYKVVLCPRIPLYFDFDQDESHRWGRKSSKVFVPIEAVYRFPPDTLIGIDQYNKQILGIQANLWTETVHSTNRFDYMAFPRLSALSEAAWSTNSRKDFSDFSQRLKVMLTYLDKLKINYFNPFHPELTPEPPGPKKLEIKD